MRIVYVVLLQYPSAYRKKEKGAWRYLSDTVMEPPRSHRGEWSRRCLVWTAFALFSERMHFLYRKETRGLPHVLHGGRMRLEGGADVVHIGLCLLCAPLGDHNGSVTVSSAVPPDTPTDAVKRRP